MNVVVYGSRADWRVARCEERLAPARAAQGRAFGQALIASLNTKCPLTEDGLGWKTCPHPENPGRCSTLFAAAQRRIAARSN